jgi:hypothetical protein
VIDAARSLLPRVALGVCILCGLLALATPALAVDRRAEAAANEALTVAATDHAARDYDGALLLLVRATRGCSSSKCNPRTKAALLRDSGVMQFEKGEKVRASALFREALDIDAELPWNAVYDAAETIAEWAAVKDEVEALHETAPAGDLAHVPEGEQVVNTPLPIYAELNVPGIANVVVKYRVPGQREFRRKNLPRFGGGWGGAIPCSDVRRGVIRYYLQAFDAAGESLGNTGDVKHLFTVPIRWEISTDPPHLPGRSAPEPCNGGASEEEVTKPGPEAPASAAGGFVRLWVGVAGSIDLTVLPSSGNACALNPGTAVPILGNFYCTNPDGSDFPSRASPVQNSQLSSSNAAGGPTSGDVRILATFDYAVTSHFLTGARVGYVAGSYPGAAASNDGHGISTPLHLELRETYLFGDSPLSRSGVAPYAFVSAGYAKIDASQVSTETLTGVAGARPVVIWTLGGPFFVAAGGGARYAFSPRVAFMAGLKAALPFGSGGILPTLAPELSLQYGF